MGDFEKATSESSDVRAILIGGPADIPDLIRSQKVGPHEDKIKIRHYGGYEHFERAENFDHDTLPQQIVYRWTMRTNIAE